MGRGEADWLALVVGEAREEWEAVGGLSRVTFAGRGGGKVAWRLAWIWLPVPNVTYEYGTVLVFWLAQGKKGRTPHSPVP